MQQPNVTFSHEPAVPRVGDWVTLRMRFSAEFKATISGSSIVTPNGHEPIPAIPLDKEYSFVALQSGLYTFTAKVLSKGSTQYATVKTFDVGISPARTKYPLRNLSCAPRAQSGPIVAQSGQVIENLEIDANGTPAITIANVSNVRVRNVRIRHHRGIGIDIRNSPNTAIENVDIIDSSGSHTDLATITERTFGISCSSSSSLNIQQARITNSVNPISLTHCPSPFLRFIEMHNVTSFSANKSDFGTLEDFSVENDLSQVVTSDNINVFDSIGWTILKGHVDGNNSQLLDISGAGVIFDQSVRESRVEDVDVMNQINTCFNAADNNRNNTFIRTRCLNTACFARYPNGQVKSATGAYVGGWGAFATASGINVVDSSYWHLCPTGNVHINQVYPGVLSSVQVTQQEFVPRAPQRVQYCF